MNTNEPKREGAGSEILGLVILSLCAVPVLLLVFWNLRSLSRLDSGDWMLIMATLALLVYGLSKTR
jgi:hypothetical protein